MDGKPGDGWEEELERWLEPFLDRLRAWPKTNLLNFLVFRLGRDGRAAAR